MAFDTRNLTTDYKKLMSIPVMNRTALAQSGLLNDMLSMLTPTQYSSLFPSYYKESLPSISGFETAVTRTTMSGGGGGGTTGGGTGGGTGYTAGTGSSVTATPVKPSITPSQQRAAEKAGLGYLLPDQTNVKGSGIEGIKDSTHQKMKMSYDAFVNAGFSHNQSLSLVAEVGRENGFQEKFMFGTHSDPYNNATNLGMLSMQGPRLTALKDHLMSEGRFSKSGELIPDQETMNSMARFYMKEMQTTEKSKKVEQFLSNPNIDPANAAYLLGTGYIRWRYEDPKYAKHHEYRDQYYNTINDITKDFGSRGPTPAELNQIQSAQGVSQGTSDVFPADQQTMTGSEIIPISETIDNPKAYGQSATKNAKPASGVVFHVAGTQSIEDQIKSQQTPRGGGSSGYGYHYVISKDGKIYQLQSTDKRMNQMKGSSNPARTGRLDLDNTNTIGVGFITGGGKPTEEQMLAAQKLTPQIYLQNNIPTTYTNEKGEVLSNAPVAHGSIQPDEGRATLGHKNTPEGVVMTQPFIENWNEISKNINDMREGKNKIPVDEKQTSDAQNVLDIVPKSDVLPPEQQQMAPTAEPVTEATPADTPSELNAVNNYETGTANAGYAEEVKMVDNKTGQTIGNVGTGEAVGITKDNKVAVTSEARLNASQILPKMNMNMSNPNAQSMPQNGPQVDPTRSRQVASAVNNLDPMRLTADNSFEPSPSFDRSMGRVVESGNRYNSRGVPWSNV
jgi:hypothetical protein